jgi:hypothetical protein
MCPSGLSKHTANEQAIIKPGPVFNLITSRRAQHEFCYWNQVFAVFSMNCTEKMEITIFLGI